MSVVPAPPQTVYRTIALSDTERKLNNPNQDGRPLADDETDGDSRQVAGGDKPTLSRCGAAGQPAAYLMECSYDSI